MIEGTKTRIAELGLEDRCEAVAGSFFERVPEGADAYFMKFIIHDWQDARAIEILRARYRAMPDDGTLLVADMVIPEGNDFFFGKLIDLEMLLIPGGKERTAEEFRELFAAAGFELSRIIPTACPLSIVEGRKAR